ncbi:MAG TPA: hypothetical protein VD913_05495 [bacterium]|nr:hypothetical protein [bacterium]
MKKGGLIGFLIVLLVLAGIAAGAASYIIKYQIVHLPPFEINNYFGQAEIFTGPQKAWRSANRGESFGEKDRLRTPAQSEIDFGFQKSIFLRLKENSQVAGRSQWPFVKEHPFRLSLERGVLLGAIDKSFDERKLEISTPTLVAVASSGAVFRVVVDESSGLTKTWIGVLRGEVKVRKRSLRAWFKRQYVTLRGLERSDAASGLDPKPAERVSREEWNDMKEAYELVQKGSLSDADQLDLSKRAGNMFKHVFDHGTFYTPKVGFCNRDFLVDEGSNEVYLQVEYDVFPPGSFVGVYLKTRDFDLAKFKTLKFDVKKDPEEGFPDTFRVEMKAKSGVMRAFAPGQFKPEWETIELPLHFAKPAPIDEITFVFTNAKVGEHKKGILYFKNFTLVPFSETASLEPVPSEEVKVALAEPLKRAQI